MTELEKFDEMLAEKAAQYKDQNAYRERTRPLVDCILRSAVYFEMAVRPPVQVKLHPQDYERLLDNDVRPQKIWGLNIIIDPDVEVGHVYVN